MYGTGWQLHRRLSKRRIRTNEAERKTQKRSKKTKRSTRFEIFAGVCLLRCSDRCKHAYALFCIFVRCHARFCQHMHTPLCLEEGDPMSFNAAANRSFFHCLFFETGLYMQILSREKEEEKLKLLQCLPRLKMFARFLALDRCDSTQLIASLDACTLSCNNCTHTHAQSC